MNEELILGYTNKHSVLGANIGKKILVREIDLCENFPDTQRHPRNLGVSLTPLESIALQVCSFAQEF